VVGLYLQLGSGEPLPRHLEAVHDDLAYWLGASERDLLVGVASSAASARDSMLSLPSALQATCDREDCRLLPFELEARQPLPEHVSLHYALSEGGTYLQLIPCTYTPEDARLQCEGRLLDCNRPVERIWLYLHDLGRQIWTGTATLEWQESEPVVPVLQKRPRSVEVCATDGCGRMSLVGSECLVCHYRERVEGIRKRRAALSETVRRYRAEAVPTACRDIEAFLTAKEAEVAREEECRVEGPRLEILEQSKAVKDSV
jgi:hypothetical protein